MNIEKLQWQRTDEKDCPCDNCSRRASWVIRYDVLEHSYWKHSCSEHRESGKFVCYAGNGYCEIKEIV